MYLRSPLALLKNVCKGGQSGGSWSRVIYDSTWHTLDDTAGDTDTTVALAVQDYAASASNAHGSHHVICLGSAGFYSGSLCGHRNAQWGSFTMNCTDHTFHEHCM